MQNRGFPRLGWALAVIATVAMFAAPPGVDAFEDDRGKRGADVEERLDAAERKVQAARERYEEAVRALMEARGAVGSPAQHRKLTQRLATLEEELVSLRRRGGSDADRKRIELAIERTRRELADDAERREEIATSKRFERLSDEAEKQHEQLRRAEEYFAKVRAQIAARETDRATDVAHDDRKRRARRVNELEAEIRDLRKQLQGAQHADSMTARLRERVEGRLQQAREEALEAAVGLREAEERGLGANHPEIIERRRATTRAQSLIAALEEQLEEGGVDAAAGERREELEHAIEMRMKQIRELTADRERIDARRRDAGRDRDRPAAGRDELAARVERLGVAIEEIHRFLRRHAEEHARGSTGVGATDAPPRRIATPPPAPRRPPVDAPAGGNDARARMQVLEKRIAELEAENARLTKRAAELQIQFEHLRDHGHYHEPGEE